MELDLSPETVSWLVNIELPTVLENEEVEGQAFEDVANFLYIMKHALENCNNKPITLYVST